MSEFAWVINAELESWLGHQGVSDDYVIPRTQMNGAEGQLAGTRLWIVLRGEEDRCVASIAIRRVEIIDDGYYKNDFLITCDLLASFRVSSSCPKGSRVSVEDFRTCPIGISKLSLSQIDALRTAVLQKIQVRISRPLDNIFDNLKFIHLPETSRAIARMGISSILRNFALDDVWAYGLGDRNSPFAFFTTCMLEHRGIDSSRFTDFLIETDPITQLLSTIKSSEIDERNVENTDIDTHVDLSFSEIDPKKLVARTFVAQECDKRNVSESLSKTEEAEKMHQGMLKDISLFLKSQGIIPFQSASIDLVYWVEEKTYFYEIKSATPENILAQAAKGAFQIACYSREMDADYSSVHSALILQKIDDLRLEIFVKKTLGYLGIKCLFYDRVVAWPNRVDGLLSGC